MYTGAISTPKIENAKVTAAPQIHQVCGTLRTTPISRVARIPPSTAPTASPLS